MTKQTYIYKVFMCLTIDATTQQRYQGNFVKLKGLRDTCRVLPHPLYWLS